MITPAQIRAARALLNMEQGVLAKHAGLSPTGLSKVERGEVDPRASTLARIQTVLEALGIEFRNEGGSIGVTLRKS